MPRLLLLLSLMLGCVCAFADPRLPPQQSPPAPADDGLLVDAKDALRSKEYVQRTILSEVIHTTSRFDVGRFYINHMLGFNSVWQRVDSWAKYTSGIQGLSLGYVFPSGHGIEIGGEFSTVSNLFLGYRYYIRPKDFSLWPFLGVGVGTEVPSLNLGEGPAAAQFYNGQQKMVSSILGILIPLVDIGLKAEVRFDFYGTDRIILTTGIGAILFL